MKFLSVTTEITDNHDISARKTSNLVVKSNCAVIRSVKLRLGGKYIDIIFISSLIYSATLSYQVNLIVTYKTSNIAYGTCKCCDLLEVDPKF